MDSSKRKAVVLVSGGLDSATVLAIASEAGYETYALSIAYGQRHITELEAARRVVARLRATEHRIMEVNLAAIGGSALTDSTIAVPESAGEGAGGGGSAAGIPVTYVPARNTLFLALALGWAEVIGARDLFIGVNAVDYSGYPDCRPEFIRAFESLARLATKAGVEGAEFSIHAPLLDASKAEIIRRGFALGVDFAETVSCYQADAQGRACGRCDSCRLRSAGFADADLADPTCYQS